MENSINELMKTGGNKLSIYYTAGYPSLDSTLEIAKNLEAAGADMLEIGIPFSDPVADGPVIQESNQQALDNGMTLAQLLTDLSDLRKHVSIPVILMGYFNPVLQYGMEKFCERCSAIGIDGLILPDLPIEEYTRSYQEIFEKHGLSYIPMITPQTADERIRYIDQHARGFIYMVSSPGITGATKAFSEEAVNYFQRIKNMALKTPALIGFGISNQRTFQTVCQYSHGAIIGSAFIKHLQQGSSAGHIQKFIQNIQATC